MEKLIARPLIVFNKMRKVNPVIRDGRVYLHITPTRYLGSGETLEAAISDANARTFATGYLVERA